MAKLSYRQVSTLMLFAAGDSGVTTLEKHFGPAGSDLDASPGVSVAIVPGLDHDLTGSEMRQVAAQRMIDFLQELPSVRHCDTRNPTGDLSAAGFHKELR
jgi:hypothetical protein